MNEENPILSKSIQSFSFSDEFLEMCNTNGFSTLGEIVQLQVNELFKMTGFNLRMLKELYQILEDNKLEKWLRE
jgi:DNA-directed RNA polymerase alpha subunit